MFSRIRKAFLLLDRTSRLRWICLVPLSLVEGVVESVGAAAVFSLIRVIDQPERVFGLPVLGSLYEALGWSNGKTIILSFTLLITCYYIGKNLFLMLSIYLRARMTSATTARLSTRLLRSYLAAPYTLHLQRNSADFISRITRSVDTTVRMTLESGVAITSEVLVLCGIVAVLVMASPMMTLVSMGVLVVLLLVLLVGTQRLFYRMGSRQQQLNQKSLGTIQQALGGIKEVKAMGKEAYWYNTYAQLQQAIAKIQRWHSTLNHVPRAIVETVFICIPLVMVIISLERYQQGSEGVLPLLGLFAYAGFRAIPSFNRLTLNFNNIRYSGAEVDLLHRDLDALMGEVPESAPGSTEEKAVFRRELRLEGVSYTYEEKGAPVLMGVDLIIKAGESVGIAGVTGSGKSTLLDLILGLLDPTEGRITVDGLDIHLCLKSWRNLIGYVPQQIYLMDDTLRRNIAFGVPDEAIDETRVWESVRMAQLEHFLGLLPQGLDSWLGERGVKISGGEKQRVAIARALYRRPELVIFDEATSALDRYTEKVLTEALNALHGEITMIVVAHRLSTLRHCDQVVFIHEGRIEAIGPLAELMEKNAAFRKLTSTN